MTEIATTITTKTSRKENQMDGEKNTQNKLFKKSTQTPNMQQKYERSK